MHRLRNRLIAAFLVATVLPLGATLWITASLLDSSLGYATTEELDRLSRTLEGTVRQFYQRERVALRTEALAGRVVPTPYLVVDLTAWPEQFREFWESGEPERFDLSGLGGDHLDYMRRADLGVEVYSRNLGGIRMRELSAEFGQTRELVGSIEARDQRRGFTLPLLLLIALVLLVSLVPLLFIAHRFSRPIQQLTDGLTDFAAGNWDRRLETGRDDEVGRAVGAFNRMAEQLRRNRERLVYLTQVSSWQSLARKTAHELKNSLTPIRLTVEEMLARQPQGDRAFMNQAVQIVVDEIDTLERRVRAFSEFSSEPPMTPEVLDVNALVTDRVSLLRPAYPETTYSLRVDESGPRIRAGADLVKGILTNLLKNAAEAAGPGGRVLTVTRSRDEQVEVEVHDSGPGIAEGLCLADELLARRSLEGLGNGWAGAPEQRGKEFGEVDEPLSCGADDAGEDLLGLRAAGRPITAADFAVDDGGANGVLGTPVGGLHLGRPQEGEHGGELAVEMGGEALGGRQGGRRVEESPEAREQAPAGHGEAVLGDRVRLPSITEREGVGEDRLHASRPRTARMIRGEGMRSAHQVRQTRLMQRRGEAAIRRPPVSHQDAVKVGAQHLGRLVEATPVANAIHRGLRRRKRPQPVPHRADPPAGLVGAHDGTAADLCAQRGVGRGGHAGRAMQHLHEPPGRHRQPEALPQECGHLGEGHADLLVQARNQGDGARPQVDVGGPHRVRGLQRMAALHAAPALGALPDGHIKAPDNRPDDGEIFLVLRRHALQCHRPAAPRTRRRERGLVGRINPGGNRATRPASIPTAGPPPRPPAPALGPIFGERCGLTEPRAPRGTE